MAIRSQVTVPDTSENMSAAAARLETISGGFANYTSFVVATETTVWMLVSSDSPSCDDVVNAGVPLFYQVPVSVQVTDFSSPQFDPSMYYFATKSGDGPGDVRIVTGSP